MRNFTPMIALFLASCGIAGATQGNRATAPQEASPSLDNGVSTDIAGNPDDDEIWQWQRRESPDGYATLGQVREVQRTYWRAMRSMLFWHFCLRNALGTRDTILEPEEALPVVLAACSDQQEMVRGALLDVAAQQGAERRAAYQDADEAMRHIMVETTETLRGILYGYVPINGYTWARPPEPSTPSRPSRR